MSDDNKAIAARALDCFNTGDVDSLDELVAPDAQDHDTQNPHRDTHGPEGPRKVVEMYRGAFPDLKLTVEEQIAESWGNWDTLGMMQQLGAIPAPAEATA